jgi:serine/threonine-protein kinase
MDPTALTPASDQYSLGCVMYYCLTGRMPFPGNNAVEKMMCHQTREPTPIKELAPDVPDEYISVVSRLMSKGPEDRYPSVTDVIVSLRPLAKNLNPYGSSVSLPVAQCAPAPAPTKPKAPARSVTAAPSAPSHPRTAAQAARTLVPPLPDRRSMEMTTPTSQARDTVAIPPKPAPDHRAAAPAAAVGYAAPQAPRPARPPQKLAHLRGQVRRPETLEDRVGTFPLVVGMALLSCVVGLLLSWWLGW